MSLTTQLKKRFVKDIGIQVMNFNEPYFYNTLELLDNEFNTLRKYDQFKFTVHKLGGESAYFKEVSRIVKVLQESIKSSPKYNIMKEMNVGFLTDFTRTVKQNHKTKKELYSSNNLSNEYISIDISKSNFTVFKNQGIILENSWDDFIGTQTTLNHFIESKFIRQLTFGGLLDKKLRSISENYIATILAELKLPKNIETIMNSDELLICVNELDNEQVLDIIKKTKTIIEDLNKYFYLKVDIETFELHHVEDKKGKIYFIKNYGDHVELKAIPLMYFNQVFKYVHNIPITSEDLHFMYEGLEATFNESIFK